MRQMVAAVCLTLGIVATAFAQAPIAERGRAAGSLGGGQTWDDEGSIGNGPGAGARVEWRLGGRTSVEGSFDVLRHERSGAFQADGTSRILGVSLMQRFGPRAVEPYVLGGIDLVSHSGTTTFGELETDRSSSDLGVHFGGGLAFAITGRVAVGPEARFFIMRPDDSSAPAFATWFGVRVGWTF